MAGMMTEKAASSCLSSSVSKKAEAALRLAICTSVLLLSASEVWKSPRKLSLCGASSSGAYSASLASRSNAVSRTCGSALVVMADTAASSSGHGWFSCCETDASSASRWPSLRRMCASGSAFTPSSSCALTAQTTYSEASLVGCCNAAFLTGTVMTYPSAASARPACRRRRP